MQIFYSLSAAVAGGTARDVAKIETAREGRTRTVGFGLRLFSPSSGADCFQARAFALVRQATRELKLSFFYCETKPYFRVKNSEAASAEFVSQSLWRELGMARAC